MPQVFSNEEKKESVSGIDTTQVKEKVMGFTVEAINLDRLIFSDPADNAGIRLPSFSLNQIYQTKISDGKIVSDDVRKKLYDRVYKYIQESGIAQLGSVSVKVIDYTDYAGYAGKNKRRYIRAAFRTGRNSNATIFIRFLQFGDELYLGIDSYVLGQINILKLIICAIPLLFTVISLWQLLASLVSHNILFGVLSGFNAVLWGLVAVPIWFKTVLRIMRTKEVEATIRQEFAGRIDTGSFTTDDILMFIKTTLRISISSVKEVFEEEGIPTGDLDNFVQNINFLNINAGQDINIGNGTNIGMNNRITNAVRQRVL